MRTGVRCTRGFSQPRFPQVHAACVGPILLHCPFEARLPGARSECVSQAFLLSAADRPCVFDTCPATVESHIRHLPCWCVDCLTPALLVGNTLRWSQIFDTCPCRECHILKSCCIGGSRSCLPTPLLARH